jgi:hypothetical protein
VGGRRPGRPPSAIRRLSRPLAGGTFSAGPTTVLETRCSPPCRKSDGLMLERALRGQQAESLAIA